MSVYNYRSKSNNINNQSRIICLIKRLTFFSVYIIVHVYLLKNEIKRFHRKKSYEKYSIAITYVLCLTYFKCRIKLLIEYLNVSKLKIVV